MAAVTSAGGFVVVDIAVITGAITAATKAVGLFDKIADQVERFITKQAAATTTPNYRMKIESSPNAKAIVATNRGRMIQTITADQMKNLPPGDLQHIGVFEQSMENHYHIWASVYPQLSIMDSPIQRAKVEQQLSQIVRNMNGDLQQILSFLEQAGLQLDDHDQRIRHLVDQYAKSASV
jgi:hypothetical protein